MNKKELVKEIATRASTDGEVSQKTAESCLDAFLDVVSDQLSKGETVALIGFGTFSVQERAARQGRNPKTGDVIEIAAKNQVKFKVGSKLDKSVN